MKRCQISQIIGIVQIDRPHIHFNFVFWQILSSKPFFQNLVYTVQCPLAHSETIIPHRVIRTKVSPDIIVSRSIFRTNLTLFLTENEQCSLFLRNSVTLTLMYSSVNLKIVNIHQSLKFISSAERIATSIPAI